MPSRAEILKALRAADAAGDTAAAKRLAAMAQAAPAEPVEEDYGPLGLGDNFARAGQTLDDSMRLIVDTASRGYVDKWMGPEEQAKTEAARQRQGWGGTAVDVASAVASSPYKVGSAAAGAGYGALEGAASSYAHSDSWVPDPLQIGKDALIGGATGGFGAKVGEWFGGRQANKAADAAQPYKSDAALDDAVSASALDDELNRLDISPRTEDLASRAAAIEAARAAQGGGRGAFARMAAGMDDPAMAYKAADIAGGPRSVTAAVGGAADRLGKNATLPVLLADAVASGGIPYRALAGMGARKLLSQAGQSNWATRVPGREIEDFASIARNVNGIEPDQLLIDSWRDRASKVFSGYGRTP